MKDEDSYMAKTLTVDRYWEYRMMVSDDLKGIDNEEDMRAIIDEITSAMHLSMSVKKEELMIASKNKELKGEHNEEIRKKGI